MSRCRTTTGLGRVVSGQVDVFAGPVEAYEQPGSVPGVIYCHGAAKVANDITNPASIGEYPIFDALRQKYCVGVGDNEFTSWGNDATLADVLATYTWMQTMGSKPGKIAIGGASMGVTVAMNFALAHPDKVSCVFGFIPAVNPPSNPAFTASLNTSFPPTYNDAINGPTHNPTNYAANFPNIPVHLWYSLGDTVAYPQYVAQFAATCPSASATICSTTGDHNQATIATVPIGDVMAFVSANLS